jgi:hypothetical protein
MSGKSKYKSESTSMNNTGPTTRPRRCKIRRGSPICGSLAIFTAILRASSLLSNLAAEQWPASYCFLICETSACRAFSPARRAANSLFKPLPVKPGACRWPLLDLPLPKPVAVPCGLRRRNNQQLTCGERSQTRPNITNLAFEEFGQFGDIHSNPSRTGKAISVTAVTALASDLPQHARCQSWGRRP